MLYFDTETCGLHGYPILLQYAFEDDIVSKGREAVCIWNFWKHSIAENMEVIETLANYEHGICAFNAVFDWFHLVKMYTTCLVLKQLFNLEYRKTALESYIEHIVDAEPIARNQLCIKPKQCFDLFLHARKTKYQATMDRKPIKIKRVPTVLAERLASELEERIPIKDIYFARKKTKGRKWEVFDTNDLDFKDIKLIFAPSSALKALAGDALGVTSEDIIRFKDIKVDKKYQPHELGFAPFAKAIKDNLSDPESDSLIRKLLRIKSSKINIHTWDDVIHHHIEHWENNTRAREYASNDVLYLHQLYEHFGRPEINDNDSVLAYMIGASRWKGYSVDIEKLKKLKHKVREKRYYYDDKGRKLLIPTAPSAVKEFVCSELDDIEKVGLVRSTTKKQVLEAVSKLTNICECQTYDFLGEVMNLSVKRAGATVKVGKSESTKQSCEKCKGLGQVLHPAAKLAKMVLDARQSIKEEEIYDKLIIAGRFHASFKVIGALSSRMSGADGLNPQGIKATKQVRGCFPLADSDDGYVLCGGDFEGFEVTLAEAVYNDKNLRKDLLTCEKCESPMHFDSLIKDFTCEKCGGHEGKAIHALFGMHVYPGMDYWQIKNTKGAEHDIYTNCKRCVFLKMYGGTTFAMQERLGVDLETAIEADRQFEMRYPGVRLARLKVEQRFQSMRQPNGIGTKVEWHEPDDYIETMFGFRRYFTLENMICKSLFNMAQEMPKKWKDIEGVLKTKTIRRRDRFQTATGAVSSALYASAFTLQSQNTRAAQNHVIQGSGAQITKHVQRCIWDLQPSGVHEWIVQPMNIHDEIMCPVKVGYEDVVKQTALDTVELYRERVPLIKLTWNKMKSWAEK